MKNKFCAILKKWQMAIFVATLSTFAMNRFLLFVLISFNCQNISAQSLCQQVIGANGQSTTTSQGIEIAFTIGQAIGATFSSPVLTLTQGYHQPDLCTGVSGTHPGALPVIAPFLYPNPASNTLYFQLTTPFQEQLFLRIIDLNGRVMRLHAMQAGYLETEMDISDLSSGVYRVVFSDKNQNVLAQLPLVHL
jgi:hypothetical protein